MDTEDVKEELRAELLRRVEIDQAARNRSREADEDVARVDAVNTAWLREVIATSGWPLRSQVGEDGAAAAWLLAQHADADPAFQRECLHALTAAADRGEAARSTVAYLTDRVLVAEGRPQLYGTQVTARRRAWVPLELASPETVDERRAAMDLEPLADYLAGFAAMIGDPVPAKIECLDCGAPIEAWLPGPGEETSISCPACGRSTTLSVRPG